MDHSTRHPNLSSSSFRRLVLSLGFAVAGVISEAPAEAIAAAAPDKVLRIASPDIDTLDPHQFNDDPSFQVISAIFEGLYEWD